MPTAAITTLGCRLNQADEALMADNLARHGYTVVPWGGSADLLVINSCAVTAAAGQKTRQTARAARRANPGAFLVLAGCGADTDAKAWQQSGMVDLVVPNSAKTRLSAVLPPLPLREALGVGHAPAAASPGAGRPVAFTEEGCGLYLERTRANLKIQEGCDFGCTYCIVPRARGPARSRAWDDVLREARELTVRGHRELVLTGVNIACYGDGRRRLPDLVEALLALADGFRLRLSSTEPGAVLPDLLALMASSPRLCRFLHLPLQYGEDSTLIAMRRRYTVAQFAEFAKTAAATIPGLCLGTDIMVGFPGETEDRFRTCMETVRALPFAYCHVFRYSRRPGTPAADLPEQVDGRTAAARHRRLSELADEKSRAFAAWNVGRTVEVLTETRNATGNWEGWSDNYLRVEITGSAGTLAPNELLPVHVTDTVDGRRVRGAIPAG